jgi:hypothetical protein
MATPPLGMACWFTHRSAVIVRGTIGTTCIFGSTRVLPSAPRLKSPYASVPTLTISESGQSYAGGPCATY